MANLDEFVICIGNIIVRTVGFTDTLTTMVPNLTNIKKHNSVVINFGKQSNVKFLPNRTQMKILEVIKKKILKKIENFVIKNQFVVNHLGNILGKGINRFCN